MKDSDLILWKGELRFPWLPLLQANCRHFISFRTFLNLSFALSFLLLLLHSFARGAVRCLATRVVSKFIYATWEGVKVGGPGLFSDSPEAGSLVPSIR